MEFSNKLEDTKKDIITEDSQAKEHEDGRGDTGKVYPYDPTKTDIDIREDKQSIYQFMRQYDREQLVIDPEYQRNLVWKPKQKSRFIESIVLNFPLPPFYVNQQLDGRYVIIDGLQRTTALHDFINNKFALSDLEALPSLNNLYFKDLTSPYQAKIEDKNLMLYVIKPSVPIEVVYELFDRINTGGTPLNRQEVRNCIFLGRATELLKELSKQDYFSRAIDNGVSSTRMKDREVILRYLAFKIFDYKKDYKGDLSAFLEEAMKKINDLKKMGEDEIEILKQDFKRVMELSYDFFENRNFRYPIIDKEGNIASRGFINTSMFESISYFFSNNTDDFLRTHRERIIQNYDELLKNQTYFNAVRFSTGSKVKVIDRFKLAQEILSKVD